MASVSVVPDGAVTRSVDMTAVTGSEVSGWNWMSRVVIMPMSGERRNPLSVTTAVSAGERNPMKSVIFWLLLSHRVEDFSPHYDGIALVERKLMKMLY